jgi:hypothetical protein
MPARLMLLMAALARCLDRATQDRALARSRAAASTRLEEAASARGDCRLPGAHAAATPPSRAPEFRRISGRATGDAAITPSALLKREFSSRRVLVQDGSRALRGARRHRGGRRTLREAASPDGAGGPACKKSDSDCLQASSSSPARPLHQAANDAVTREVNLCSGSDPA